ncbi:MAG TPA: hypothetical protein VGB07_14150 [Blastocatellia bacterium]
MPEWQPPRPIEIDKKLRDDFRRLLKEYGITTQETDPILAVMFRSFAAQLAEVYEQAATSIPLAILDELMAGLGMPERRARAAQTVVRFALKDGREVFEAGTELIGEAASREKLTFALDCGLEVSNAEIALVAIYQDGKLRLHQGTEPAKEFEQARPSFEAVAAELGPRPAIFIAVNCDAEHLSRHGIYFELSPEARDLRGYLQREVWCLLDEAEGIQKKGLVRPRVGNAGVQRLDWLIGAADEPGTEERQQRLGSRLGTKSLTTQAWADDLLPAGVYGNQSFLLPSIPVDRRFLAKLPKRMEAPLRRIFQQSSQNSGQNSGKDLFERRRAWFYIGLPQEARSISEDLVRVVLHCATASNIEILNETISLPKDGKAIPVANGSRRHLVKPLSIKGERGAEYLPETEPSADEFAGRYKIRQGILEIVRAASTTRGEADDFANVRLLLCNGGSGNNVAPGGIKNFLNRSTPRTLEIRNLTQAKGGDDGETLPHATERFTEMLLSRERPVTLPDLEAVVKTFEPKIREVKAESVLERGADGLHRVQRVTVMLDHNDFALPEEEAAILKRELETTLQERSLLGLKVRVEAKLRGQNDSAG